ncbi:MAG: molybdopterin-dependent oxidoreductase [Promethearchaeota archaeon]
MQRRNFYILLFSIIFGNFVIWINVYAFIILDASLPGDTVTFKGDGIISEVSISLSDVKSNEYQQVIDKEFSFINSGYNEYTDIYSGASLWSIIQVEVMLLDDPSYLTFRFYAYDGYSSPSALNLSLAMTYPEDVIIAYENDGVPLNAQNGGPLRSIINRNIIPSLFNSQYAVQQLKFIVIDYA